MRGYWKKRSSRGLIYVDSNIFLYPALYDVKTVKKAAKAATLLQRVAEGRLEASTSVLTWDEVVWGVRKLLGTDLATQQGRSFLSLPNLKLLSFDFEMLLKAQEIVEKYGLKPRDAVHAATAVRNKIVEVVSYDPDFDAVSEIKRTEP